MKDIIIALKDCHLFQGIPDETVGEILLRTSYRIQSFGKNQLVIAEGDECKNLGIIIKGSVEVKKIYISGRSLTITVMNKGNIFGEVIVFSSINKFPSTIMSLSECSIMFISKEEILNLCSSNFQFLNNLMGLLSDKVLMLSSKIKDLSCQTLRQKVINYLMHEYEKQRSMFIKLPSSRGEMAEQLGIPRPSLSRELSKMKNEGLIDFYMDNVRILQLDSLENLINGTS